LVLTRTVSNEFGSLAQGVDALPDLKKSIRFITKGAVPQWKIVAYGCFMVDVCPNKSEVPTPCMPHCWW
jgi:hypothetical protein